MALTTVAEREITVKRGEGGVTVVTLDRPSQRNALTWRMWEYLQQTHAETREGSKNRAFILKGAGGCFSAGRDVKPYSARGHGVGAAAARLAVAQRVIAQLQRLPQVTIATADRFVVGTGWCLVLDGEIAWFLTRTVGARRAADPLLTRCRLSATDAHRDGLVSRTVATGTALDTAMELAEQLGAGPRDAQGLTKRMLRFASEVSFERFLEMEWTTAALDLHGDEAAEGRRSFIENRLPEFTAVDR